jgi:hypothetical protein
MILKDQDLEVLEVRAVTKDDLWISIKN